MELEEFSSFHYTYDIVYDIHIHTDGGIFLKYFCPNLSLEMVSEHCENTTKEKHK